jgi:hypothetical protein
MIRTVLLTVMSMAIAAHADFSGTWELKSGTKAGGVSVSVPAAITLTLQASDSGYHANFHASNHMGGGMQMINEISDNEATIQFSPMTSTRMMPPPSFQDVESFITQTIPTMTRAFIDDQGELKMEGPLNVEAAFARTEDQDE